MIRALSILFAGLLLIGCGRKAATVTDQEKPDDKSAKDLIKIEGQVMLSGRPVPECKIELAEIKAGKVQQTSHTTRADKEGNYEVSGLHSGKYRTTIYLKGENSPVPESGKDALELNLPPNSSGKTVKWTIHIR